MSADARTIEVHDQLRPSDPAPERVVVDDLVWNSPAVDRLLEMFALDLGGALVGGDK